jgi:Flp pilus assembly protein TadG
MAVARRREGQERGFVLVTMAVAAIALMGVLGLAVDLGHMFVSKNETQAYCDSAALAAALALDGTTSGIANAKAAVTASTNAWNFSTVSVPSPTVTFATALTGPWHVVGGTGPGAGGATGATRVKLVQ